MNLFIALFITIAASGARCQRRNSLGLASFMQWTRVAGVAVSLSEAERSREEPLFSAHKRHNEFKTFLHECDQLNFDDLQELLSYMEEFRDLQKSFQTVDRHYDDLHNLYLKAYQEFEQELHLLSNLGGDWNDYGLNANDYHRAQRSHEIFDHHRNKLLETISQIDRIVSDRIAVLTETKHLREALENSSHDNPQTLEAALF